MFGNSQNKVQLKFNTYLDKNIYNFNNTVTFPKIIWKEKNIIK